MDYNTQLEKLILPEYGRNIQKMVDHCTLLEDRDERKLCAQTIVNIMGNMFPHLRDVNDFKHILWDHLAIMSDFKLDIDYPYEIVKKEDLFSSPGKIEYSTPSMKFMHYGKTLQKLIEIAADYPQGEEREVLINMVANQMKKSYLQWNKEVDNEKIYKDLCELSEGKIEVNEDNCRLLDVKNLNSMPRKKLKNQQQQRRR